MLKKIVQRAGFLAILAVTLAPAFLRGYEILVEPIGRCICVPIT